MSSGLRSTTVSGIFTASHLQGLVGAQVQISLQRVSLEAGARIEGSGKVVGIGLNGQIGDCRAHVSAGWQFLNLELAIAVPFNFVVSVDSASKCA